VTVADRAADPATAPAARLRGRRIAVTRPREQSQRLAAAIEAAGGAALVFPLIEIGAPPDAPALDALIDGLDDFDWAFFSSPTAVDRALERILGRRALPVRWNVAAIGEGTQRALARHGIDDVIAPTARFDSEALLALPALERMSGCRVVIFRGHEGREALGDGLTTRGARVQYAECYTRYPPAGGASVLIEAARAGTLDGLVITSSEALRNLVAMCAGSDASSLLRVPVFVPHVRIGEATQAAGFVRVMHTDGGDSGVLRALLAAFDAEGSMGAAQR